MGVVEKGPFLRGWETGLKVCNLIIICLIVSVFVTKLWFDFNYHDQT